MLTAVFTLLLIFALYLGRPFLLPIVVALLLALLLRPIVRLLRRIGMPEGLGAAFVVLGLLGLGGLGAVQLAEPAGDWLARVPSSLRKIEEKIRVLKRPVEEVTKATEQVEKIATVTEGKPTTEVQLKEETLSHSLFSRAKELFTSTLVTIALLYFILATGDLFLQKAVHVIPSLQNKKRAVSIAREIEGSISRYFVTVAAVNTLVGIATALVCWMFGMPNPTLWGAVAGILNFIPYIGVLTNLVILGSVALLSSEQVGQTLLVPPIYLGIHLLETNFVTPKVLGARFQLNPVAVFVSLTFWLWLWGIPGALIAVPLLKMIKTVCDHVERLKPLGEFLGD